MTERGVSSDADRGRGITDVSMTVTWHGQRWGRKGCRLHGCVRSSRLALSCDYEEAVMLALRARRQPGPPHPRSPCGSRRPEKIGLSRWRERDSVLHAGERAEAYRTPGPCSRASVESIVSLIFSPYMAGKFGDLGRAGEAGESV